MRGSDRAQSGDAAVTRAEGRERLACESIVRTSNGRSRRIGPAQALQALGSSYMLLHTKVMRNRSHACELRSQTPPANQGGRPRRGDRASARDQSKSRTFMMMLRNSRNLEVELLNVRG